MEIKKNGEETIGIHYFEVRYALAQSYFVSFHFLLQFSLPCWEIMQHSFLFTASAMIILFFS
jgi:hypothetical protein